MKRRISPITRIGTAYTYVLGTLCLSGCLGFEEHNPSTNSALASCWAESKNMEEMRACEEKHGLEGRPVQTWSDNQKIENQRPDYMRNEALSRNSTASKA